MPKSHVATRPTSFASIRDRIDEETWRIMVARYVWWESPTEAARYPERVIARVMRMGDFEDMETIARQVGDDTLRDVIMHAEAGWFDEPSWYYWHYRLNLSEIGEVPPLPKRMIP